jgi:hypothetical protein
MIIRRYALPGRPVERISYDTKEPPPLKRFTPRWIDKGLREGWITKGVIDGFPSLTFHSVPRVVYKLVRPPGCWCVHCGLTIPRDQAPDHVARQHPNTPSPDPEAPFGFRVDHVWEAIRVE